MGASLYSSVGLEQWRRVCTHLLDWSNGWEFVLICWIGSMDESLYLSAGLKQWMIVCTYLLDWINGWEFVHICWIEAKDDSLYSYAGLEQWMIVCTYLLDWSNRGEFVLIWQWVAWTVKKNKSLVWEAKWKIQYNAVKFRCQVDHLTFQAFMLKPILRPWHKVQFIILQGIM